MNRRILIILLLFICVMLTGFVLAPAFTPIPASATSWDTVNGSIHFIYTNIEVPRELDDWDSLEELEAFLREHRDERVVELLPGRDGEYSFTGQCVGFCIGLRDLAEGYGKNIEIMVLTPKEYKRVFNRIIKNNHAVCMAIVAGKDLYYIESGNFEVRLGDYIP